MLYEEVVVQRRACWF